MTGFYIADRGSFPAKWRLINDSLKVDTLIVGAPCRNSNKNLQLS